MISTHPDVQGSTADKLLRCIEDCYSCAQTCIACADACLAESMVEQMRQCIRLNLDCADIGAATGAMASRRTARMSRFSGPPSRLVSRPAAHAGTSASSTPASMSTAGFAPSPASAALKRAAPRSTRSTEAVSGDGHGETVGLLEFVSPPQNAALLLAVYVTSATSPKWGSGQKLRNR